MLTLTDENIKRHGTEGKKGNGSLCTLVASKLVWKSTNPGLQTFFFFYLEVYLSLYFFSIWLNNTSLLSHTVLSYCVNSALQFFIVVITCL